MDFGEKKGTIVAKSKSVRKHRRSIYSIAIVHRPYGVKVVRAGRKGERLHLSHNHLESNPPRLPIPNPFFLVRLHIFAEQHLRANPLAVTLITTVQRVRMVFLALTLSDSRLPPSLSLSLHLVVFLTVLYFLSSSFFMVYAAYQNVSALRPRS